MNKNFSEEAYAAMIERLFHRFPSFQNKGSGAYKPGIANMEYADRLMGHPHRKYKVIHVAGTNGKGSVSNMLASALASKGMKTGLYTSPHILDFRERIRVCHPDRSEGPVYELIPEQDVWDFITAWHETFDRLDLSFFEITTLMALDWFAGQDVDVVVLETGLGGRLDSTNIVSPILSVITNIGLDHCDLLGDTLPEIAAEKAGIIKPGVPVVVGESNPETDSVFECKASGPLTFADKVEPGFWAEHENILSQMDLQGEYQRKNLRTVLCALGVLSPLLNYSQDESVLRNAIIHAALRTGFRGRWEKISDDPWVICDIGHNEHGLKYNFSQLDRMKKEGECTDLVIVYGSVADKDVDAVIGLFPDDAVMVFTQASSSRALPADVIKDKYIASLQAAGRDAGELHVCEDVRSAVEKACGIASSLKKNDAGSKPLVYIGGSTYVVSEAVGVL